MKKTIVICIFICLVGCGKKIETNSPIKEEPQSLYQLMVENGISNGKIVCPELNDSSIVSSSHDEKGNYRFATGNNIYDINYDKIFSNDSNCTLISTYNIDAKTLYIDGTIIFLSDGFKYSTNSDGFNIIDSHKLEKNLLISYIEREYKKGFVLVYDGISFFEIEDSVIFYMNYPSNKKIADFDTGILADDEKIINIYPKNILKTSKAFYIIKSDISNKDECEKYVDKECQYKYSLVKNNLLTKYYSEILTIVSGRIITNNYEVISLDRALEYEN